METEAGKGKKRRLLEHKDYSSIDKYRHPVELPYCFELCPKRETPLKHVD